MEHDSTAVPNRRDREPRTASRVATPDGADNCTASETAAAGSSPTNRSRTVDDQLVEETYAIGEAYRTVYDRPETHGQPEDSFARIASMWRAYLMGMDADELDAVDVSNMMALLKIARSAEGHYHQDNWVDLAGYAENAARLAQEHWTGDDG
jgi:hypothetical protein